VFLDHRYEQQKTCDASERDVASYLDAVHQRLLRDVAEK
jgi:hypothetical protein